MSNDALAVPFRLPHPDTVMLGSVRWAYAVPIVSMHLLALTAFLPWLFSWTGVIAMVAGVHLFGQGINLCYHRLLAHRSARVPRWLEYAFVVTALCCMEDTPGKWVATHRHHHNHSDEQPDPHSPLVNFLWSHIGWLLVHNGGTHNVDAYRRFAPDIFRDAFYMRLERGLLWVWIYLAHAFLYFATGLAIGWAAGGPSEGVRFGLSLLVWGVIVRTVVVWHITWSVNSLTHLFGYQNYSTDDHSRNNWLVALLTVGEGWHNNHHHDPVSGSNQHRWWEFDITYYELRLLEWLGLATKVVRPRHLRHEERNREQVAGSREQVAGSRYQVSGIRNQGGCTVRR